MTDTAAPPPMPPPRGALHVARVFGINVHVHWAWLLVAVLMVQARAAAYSGLFWNISEYVALFGIVLLHEFGHALACRSVGGRAEHILLWPLGGVAYVRPPQRPGATLWVSAAGPLVNVVLVPLTVIAWAAVSNAVPGSDLAELTSSIAVINVIVLIFNVLPVYPLDGGQILRSVLWFFVGPHQSLTVATIVGLVGAGGFLLLAFYISDWWLVLIAVFSLMSSWRGLRVARARARAARVARRVTHRCPECGEPPPLGSCWPCPGCHGSYDAFENVATCPHCDHTAGAVPCVFCGSAFPAPAYFTYEVADAADKRDPGGFRAP